MDDSGLDLSDSNRWWKALGMLDIFKMYPVDCLHNCLLLFKKRKSGHITPQAWLYITRAVKSEVLPWASGPYAIWWPHLATWLPASRLCPLQAHGAFERAEPGPARSPPLLSPLCAMFLPIFTWLSLFPPLLSSTLLSSPQRGLSGWPYQKQQLSVLLHTFVSFIF